MSEVAETPYYARRNDAGFYTWGGVKYPSVTTVLGMAPGQFLLPWYGKMAALRSAAHLLDGPDFDLNKVRKLTEQGKISEKEYEELMEFVVGKTPRSLSRDDVFLEILRWGKVMREAERYRDAKAAIGSVMHHAIYTSQLNDGWRPDPKDIPDWLLEIVSTLGLANTPDPDFAPTYEMLETIAKAAHPYVVSAFKVLDVLRPKPIGIGQEAVVVHPFDEDGIGYAGTVDAIYEVNRTDWQKAESVFRWLTPWDLILEGRTRATQMWDYKSSNALAKSFAAQLEAYRHGEFIGLVESGEELDIGNIDGTAVLHVGPDEEMDEASQHEFGRLVSKAKHTGARLVCYPDDDRAWNAFQSLYGYYAWSLDPTKPVAKPKVPKPASIPKTQVRPCPY